MNYKSYKDWCKAQPIPEEELPKVRDFFDRLVGAGFTLECFNNSSSLHLMLRSPKGLFGGDIEFKNGGLNVAFIPGYYLVWHRRGGWEFVKALKSFTRPYENQPPCTIERGNTMEVLYMSMLTILRRQDEFIRILLRFVNGLDNVGKVSE